jgi:hypothetical protein
LSPLSQALRNKATMLNNRRLTGRPAADNVSKAADRVEALRPLARVLLIQARRQLAGEARERQRKSEKAA